MSLNSYNGQHTWARVPFWLHVSNSSAQEAKQGCEFETGMVHESCRTPVLEQLTVVCPYSSHYPWLWPLQESEVIPVNQMPNESIS